MKRTAPAAGLQGDWKKKAAEAVLWRAGPAQRCKAGSGAGKGSTGAVGPAQHLPPAQSNLAGCSAGEPAWVQPSWDPGWLQGWPGRCICREWGPEPFPGPCWLVPTLVPGCCRGTREADGMVSSLVLEGAQTRSRWPHLHGSWPTGCRGGIPPTEQAGTGLQSMGTRACRQEHVQLPVSCNPLQLHSRDAPTSHAFFE